MPPPPPPPPPPVDSTAPTARPSRAAKRNIVYTEQAAVRLNPANFVGYVEELETVEMIMKKFEALEEMRKEKQQAAEEAEEEEGGRGSSGKKKKSEEGEKELSEEELQELFKRTSTFTVASTVRPTGEVLLSGDGADGFDSEEEYLVFDDGWGESSDILLDDDGERYYLLGESEDEADDDDPEDGLWGESSSSRRSRHHHRHPHEPKPPRAARKQAQPKEPRKPREPSAMSLLNRSRMMPLTKRVRRRMPTDPNAVAFVRIPNEPVPSSWAKRIRQYVPKQFAGNAVTSWTSDDVLIPAPVTFSQQAAPDATLLATSDILGFSAELLAASKERGGFHCVVLNPPWKEPRPGCASLASGISPEDLHKLPLASREFLPCGFVYIWTPKHWLLRTLLALEKLDLHYVENAVVVNECVGRGPPLSQPSTYFSQQKETLLVCRRGTKVAHTGKINWEPIEMRHQRISDVYLTCFLPSSPGRLDLPAKPAHYVHKMCETMLPLSRYNTDLAEIKGRLCELWARPGMTRSGWVSVTEDKQ